MCHGTGKIERRVRGPGELLILRLAGGVAMAAFVAVSIVVIALIALAYGYEIVSAFQ